MDPNISNTCPHFLDNHNINFSVQGKQVYRDQCVRCYDDLRSEKGIDVCLKCFDGNCRSEIFNHSDLHFENTRHPLLINLREDKKEGKEPVKITKLAIGKPGGADFSGEEWEMWIKMECRICKEEIKYQNNSKLNSLVTSILSTATEDQQGGIKAWEDEIMQCEHTLTLNQSTDVKIAGKSIAKCNSCDLSSNLWLCLTCGNLSCGRKDTGGNAHAIEHYNLTKHPLVVKTGTITPSGEASIYCYSCDNDVKDPELPSHLINFGIDITTQKKTDKTVTEMNLDININITLSKTIEDGKVLTPLYGPGKTGLENLGNTCYMNSIIQILFSLEPFNKWYYDGAIEHLNFCTKKAAECYMCQMSKILYGMNSGTYSNKLTRQLPQTEDNKEGEIEEYQKGIKPSSFKVFFGKNHPEFSGNKQQDAFEYLTHLFDRFSKEEKGRPGVNPMDLFEFDIETRIESQKCHSVKYNNTKTCYLTLGVNDWKTKKEDTTSCSMEECLQRFLGEEIVELDCLKCKGKDTWTKTQKIVNFPKYLIVLFERFVYDWTPIKLEVQFQPILNNCNLAMLQRDHSKLNENIVQASNNDGGNDAKEEEIEIDFNPEDLNTIIQCGIPEQGAKWALYRNNFNAEAAIGWYCDHSEDIELFSPLPKVMGKKIPGGKSKLPNENNINNLTALGFTRAQAIGALQKNNDNFENALEYIFANPGDEGVMEIDESEQPKQNAKVNIDSNDNNGKNTSKAEKEEVNKANTSNYDLYAYITHLGKNATHGHYVSHIRDQDNNGWVYFNDTKVNQWIDPPVHKGYIYFYKNK